jgi:hypothetical protein
MDAAAAAAAPERLPLEPAFRITAQYGGGDIRLYKITELGILKRNFN